MRRMLALILLLLCLPMTKSQMIRRIRCQYPHMTYEELAPLSEEALRNLLWPGV